MIAVSEMKQRRLVNTGDISSEIAGEYRMYRPNCAKIVVKQTNSCV